TAMTWKKIGARGVAFAGLGFAFGVGRIAGGGTKSSRGIVTSRCTVSFGRFTPAGAGAMRIFGSALLDVFVPSHFPNTGRFQRFDQSLRNGPTFEMGSLVW